jgi:hypothetical protein
MDIPVGSGTVPWSARLAAVRYGPVDGPAVTQPPTRCSLIDSPTITHREAEVQLTAVSAWGEPTAAALFHGWPMDPVRTTTPAWSSRPTALPTTTQESTAVQDTPIRVAALGATDWDDQLAPPLAVVRMMPWPVRVPVTVPDVVPTATHQAPATLVGAVVVVLVEVVGGVMVVEPEGVVLDGVVGRVELGGMVVEVKGRAPLRPVFREQTMSLR